MLFLFNSAYRNTYATNVLNTLSLPEGAINVYQYSKTRGNYNYIDPNAVLENCSVNEDVMIFFIDRATPNDFKFYPLRKGKYVCGEERDGRIYYHIKLDTFCSAVNIDQYQRNFKIALQNQLFNCDSDDDNGNKSGYFAFKNDYDCFYELETNELSWSRIIESIAKCKYLAEKNICIFTRFHLYLSDGETPVKISYAGRKWHYDLKFKHKYLIKIDYCIPEMDYNPQDLVFDTELKCTIPSCQNADFTKKVGARSTTLEYELIASAIVSKAEIYYTVHPKETEYSNQNGDRTKKSVQIADKHIQISSKRSTKRWMMISLCLIGLLFCNLVTGLDTKGIIEAGNIQLSQGIQLNGYCRIIFDISNWLDKTSFIYTSATFAGLGATAFTLLLVSLYGKRDI